MTSIVSVIIPVYNGASTLSLAVESLLAQSYPHWEALIINDGSTDGTQAYLEGLKDSRIKVFHQKNAGVSAARNVGLSHMQGDYFCFLDADDALTKESLQSRLTVFANDTSVEFVDGKVHLMDMGMKHIVGEWSPNWEGNPLHDLIALSGRSFLVLLGCFVRFQVGNMNLWMALLIVRTYYSTFSNHYMVGHTFLPLVQFWSIELVMHPL